MEQPKKTSKKKAFSVPCANGKADGTAVTDTKKASKHVKKDADGDSTKETKVKVLKEKKEKTPKQKKKDKSESVPEKKTEHEMKPSKASGKLVPRTLTATEYDEIFKAVIDNCASTQDTEGNVITAPTQSDSQSECQSTTEKNTASLGRRQNSDRELEDDSDLEGSDKENWQTNEKATARGSCTDQVLRENSQADSEKETPQKPDNVKAKKNDGKSDDSLDEEEPKRETEKRITKKLDKKRKSMPKCGQDEKKEDVKTDDQTKGNDAKKKGKPVKKERKNTKSGTELGKRKGGAVAVVEEKLQADEESTVHASKDGAESDKENHEPSKNMRRKKSKKNKSAEKESSNIVNTRESNESELTKVETLHESCEFDCKVSENNCTELGKEDTDNGTGPKEEYKKEKQKKKETGKLSGKNKTKSKESSKNGPSNAESIDETGVIKTAKIDAISEASKGKDHEDEKKNEAADASEEVENEEKAEMSDEEKPACNKEDKDDVESVLSEQSLGSSLMNLELDVDQWDRLQEIQEKNEHTPCISEAEAAATEATSCKVVHKPKKKKLRENQLPPRKLAFNAAASKKKQQVEEESDSDDASSVPADLGTWVQCEVKSCQKWRYLPDVLDPVELPRQWLCSMNKDERYNSCDKSEQAYDESDHIVTQYTLGSIVWAKMDGYPWWPAIVDTDPDCDVYCHIPHENSMHPSDYHVVYLDQQVSRCWVRLSRIQHLVSSHLQPGSTFLKGHKYKREMQEAMKRADVALHMPLQDRLKHFGFSSCFRNLSNKWTKAKAGSGVKQAKKRKAPKLAKPESSKKRLVMDRRSPENGSDSDSNLSSRSDSDFEGDDDSDQEETQKKKMKTKKQAKGERKICDRKKALKEHERTVKHENVEKKSMKAKKIPKQSMNKPHEVKAGSSVKNKGIRRKQLVYSSDSESGQEQLEKSKPLKKKFKSAKKLEAKSSAKEKILTKDTSSVLKSKDADAEDNGTLNQKPSGDQSPKKKKLFKSEMAKKRDDDLKLQQKEKQTDLTAAEENKIKTKSQKFVAPVKPASKKPASNPTRAAEREADQNESEIPEHQETSMTELKDDSREIASKSPKQDQVPTLTEHVEYLPSMPSPQPDAPSPASRQTGPACLSPHASPPVSPSGRDQFVPSMDDDANKESDEDEMITIEPTEDKKWKSGDPSPVLEVGKGKLLAEEDSDSDCLDLEEDLPIPSLQQVLKVPCKGSSCRDSESDPLEMLELED